jgi:hypothetical protein
MPRQQTDEAAPTLTAERREVKRIVALLKKAPLRLADYFAIGEQMQRLSADAAVAHRGSKWRDKVAELAGCSVSTLTKAMQFQLAYQQADVPALEEQGIGWSRLTIALAVEDRRQRHELLREAKEKGWGDRQLQRAIQQHKGSKRRGGRPRKQMTSQGALADAAELVRLTGLWLEFDEKVWTHTRAAGLRNLNADAASNLAGLLKEAREGLKRLQSRCKEARAVAESLLAEMPE